MSAFTRGRRRWRTLGLATVLGVARRGYFIPYRYADRLPKVAGYEAIEALFRRREPAFAAVLDRIEAHADALRAIGDGPPPAPRWRQDWFPRLDAAAALALMRDAPPRRLVEVGSGHSTRFLAHALAGAGTRITAIDPAPRASIEGLPIEIVRATVPAVGAAPFRDLAAGDVLFIDSSHILMPGSDVDWLLNHVLPALPVGARVHIHDILLPDDYPADWAWRGYNEQLGVAALLHGGGWRVLFASHYVATRMAAALEAGPIAGLPLMPGARETSLWLEKQDPCQAKPSPYMASS